MKDKNGDLVEIGDEVCVDADGDSIQHDFVGIVTGTHYEYIVVEDMDGESFCVESNEIELE